MPTELIHILLVEDDDIDTESLVRAFKNQKIATPLHRVTNGLEALHTLRGEQGYSRLPRPYIILTDINMPQMNGYELLKALRADPLLRRSVIFVLTSSHRDEDVIQAYDLQVAGYFSKSKVGDEFAPVIRLLNLYQASIEMPCLDDFTIP